MLHKDPNRERRQAAESHTHWAETEHLRAVASTKAQGRGEPRGGSWGRQSRPGHAQGSSWGWAPLLGTPCFKQGL